MAKEIMQCECHKWKGWGMLVLGLLILLNAYWPFASWDKFLGGVLVVFGLFKLFAKRK